MSAASTAVLHGMKAGSLGRLAGNKAMHRALELRRADSMEQREKVEEHEQRRRAEVQKNREIAIMQYEVAETINAKVGPAVPKTKPNMPDGASLAKETEELLAAMHAKYPTAIRSASSKAASSDTNKSVSGLSQGKIRPISQSSTAGAPRSTSRRESRSPSRQVQNSQDRYQKVPQPPSREKRIASPRSARSRRTSTPSTSEEVLDSKISKTSNNELRKAPTPAPKQRGSVSGKVTAKAKAEVSPQKTSNSPQEQNSKVKGKGNSETKPVAENKSAPMESGQRGRRNLHSEQHEPKMHDTKAEDWGWGTETPAVEASIDHEMESPGPLPVRRAAQRAFRAELQRIGRASTGSASARTRNQGQKDQLPVFFHTPTAYGPLSARVLHESNMKKMPPDQRHYPAPPFWNKKDSICGKSKKERLLKRIEEMRLRLDNVKSDMTAVVTEQKCTGQVSRSKSTLSENSTTFSTRVQRQLSDFEVQRQKELGRTVRAMRSGLDSVMLSQEIMERNSAKEARLNRQQLERQQEKVNLMLKEQLEMGRRKEQRLEQLEVAEEKKREAMAIKFAAMQEKRKRLSLEAAKKEQERQEKLAQLQERRLNLTKDQQEAEAEKEEILELKRILRDLQARVMTEEEKSLQEIRRNRIAESHKEKHTLRTGVMDFQRTGKWNGGSLGIDAADSTNYRGDPMRDKNEDATALIRGITVRGTVKENGYEYYKFKILNTRAVIKIKLTAVAGDPDLYVGNYTCPYPIKGNATWSKAGFGDDSLSIYFFDSNFAPGWYYVGVHGAVASGYTLRVSWKEEADKRAHAKRVQERRDLERAMEGGADTLSIVMERLQDLRPEVIERFLPNARFWRP